MPRAARDAHHVPSGCPEDGPKTLFWNLAGSLCEPVFGPFLIFAALSHDYVLTTTLG